MRNFRKLAKASSLRGFSIHASNGPLGRVGDLYFDDASWRIRHLVVELGGWLSGRKVLIGAGALGRVDLAGRSIQARTSRRLLRMAPGAETALPVALQIEREIVRAIAEDPHIPEAWLALHDYALAGSNELAQADDGHLRSTSILQGCSIGAGDRLGSVEDFMVDVETWEIRYLLLVNRGFRRHLIPVADVAAIDVQRRTIAVRGAGREWLEYGPGQAALLEPHKCLVCGE